MRILEEIFNIDKQGFSYAAQWNLHAADQVGMLANQLSLKFNSPAEISIEFERITEEEKLQESLSLPASKALPIVGPD